MYKPKKLKRRKLTAEEMKRKEKYDNWLFECMLAQQKRRALAEEVVKQLKNENLLKDESEFIESKKGTRTTDEIFQRICQH